MLHKTKAIILRTVKYGDTSLVVTAFTEMFGLQSYMVNGVRTTSSKGSTKGAYFQPAAILDVVVYHNDLKNLQRIKEYKWNYLYQHILSDVHKNAVALFVIELLSKSLKEPEANNELFYFIEDALLHLDEATPTVTANFPIFFALHFANFLGFRINDEFSLSRSYLDLQDGNFVSEPPVHQQYLQGKEAATVSDILKVMQPLELQQLTLNKEQRRNILSALEKYYAFHISEFGSMRSLPVLKEISG